MIDVDALLLDMDGTLIDSNAAVERAWTTWSSDVGVDTADVLLIAHGSPAEVTVRRLLPRSQRREGRRAGGASAQPAIRRPR